LKELYSPFKKLKSFHAHSVAGSSFVTPEGATAVPRATFAGLSSAPAVNSVTTSETLS
jgi:hypothetical protein